MASPNILPVLADLRQDIAGPIPVELIKEWIESDQSAEAHKRILEPYKRSGCIVSSDSSGLSKLSAGRPLIEVMKLVSEPKEIIHAHGKAIGGKAVGVWAADNTQMFYDDAIDANEVVHAMIAAQKSIEHVLVDVGIGILKGTCYEIGGGLYGTQADEIEEFTEEESEAKEVILSESVKSELNDEWTSLCSQKGPMHVINYSKVEVDLTPHEDVYYPAPFDKQFHESLLTLDLADETAVAALHKARVEEKVIVLFRIFHANETLMLDDFVNRVAANTLIHSTSDNYDCQIVKSNGALAIIACDRESEAVDLAIALQSASQEAGYASNVSAAKGEVLIFDLGNGFWDLAGGPINITSKLAEDTNERGGIYLEASVAEHAAQHGQKTPFSIEKSGVTIEGIKIDF